MSAAISIRALTLADDLPALIPLSRVFFAEYAQHDPFFAIGTLADEDIIGFFARTLTGDDGVTLLALDGDVIVGYLVAFVREQAAMYAVRRVGAIAGLMVQREYRRRRIASRLLAETRAWFRARGIDHVTVYTSVANRAALSFYARQGMRPLQTVLLGRTGIEEGEQAGL